MEKIAVTGLACRFAGAPDVRTFQQNVMSGRSSLTALGAEIAPPVGRGGLTGASLPQVGGVLGSACVCNAFDTDVGAHVEAGENADIPFAVQLARDALEDAGMRPDATGGIRGTVRLAYAPVFNAATVNWLDHALLADQTLDVIRRYMPHASEEALEGLRRSIGDALPKPAPAAFASAAAFAPATAVARRCGFSGAATSVSAGALSSFAALSAACDDLRGGRADVVLVGAVSTALTRPALEGWAGFVPFSTERAFVPFDANASGTVPGEGGAFFVLRRRTDALNAHDRIYAVVCDGLLGDGPAPLDAAAALSGVAVPSIGLVEADGSGIPEADRAEMELVRSLWGEHHPGGPLVGMGSVKGNVGHCFEAAGAAGMLKVFLALHTRVLPPQVEPAHPPLRLSRLESSAYLLVRPRPWIVGDPTATRRAAVLGRDFGGRSAAFVFEEEPEART